MSISRAFFSLPLLLLLVLLSACLPWLRGKGGLLPPDYLTEAGPEILYALVDDGEIDSLAAAVQESLTYYHRLGQDKEIKLYGHRFLASAMEQSLSQLLAILEEAPGPMALSTGLARLFSVYRVKAPDGVLFTGYYHPLVAASLEPDETYRYPLLGQPPDLVSLYLPDICGGCPPRLVTGRVVKNRLVPYFSRAEIEAGALGEKARPIAWARDPIDLFFLQIQGSGTLLLPDGSRAEVAFAGANGHPYRSIGRYLVETGKLDLEEASADRLRRYLAVHADEREELLRYNPRYIFFKFTSEPPTGSIGVHLTPGRSIAADPQFYPPGALAFIRTTRYEPEGGGFVPFSRLVLNQDAGEAIRGPARIDIYWGDGRRAEAIAGRQRTTGELYLLMPRDRQ